MRFEKKSWMALTAAAAAIFILGAIGGVVPARAQERGPIKPPPASTTTNPPATTSDDATPPAAKPNTASSSSRPVDTAVTNDNIADAHAREAATIRNVQPSVPVDQIIKGLASTRRISRSSGKITPIRNRFWWRRWMWTGARTANTG